MIRHTTSVVGSNSGKGTILLLSDCYSEYQKQLIDPLRFQLAEAGYGLCVAIGTVVPKNSDELSGNSAFFDWLKTTKIHGVIVMTTTVFVDMAPTEIADFLKGFGDMPTLSVGAVIPEIDSLVLDNAQGMRECMQRLLASPANRVFMFIGGKSNNPNSIEREAIFRNSLAMFGITVDEDLILYNDFLTTRSYNTVKNTLRDRPDVDVVVCVNDETAQSVLYALKSMNVAVPQDVRVCGFDDSFEATRLQPTLSSTTQPFGEVARLACQRILDGLKKQPPRAQVKRVPTRFIARESTVCSNSEPPQFLFDNHDDQDLSAELVDAIIERIRQPGLQYTVPKRHLKAALREAADGSASLFHQHVQHMMSKPTFSKLDVHWWNNLAVAIDDHCDELPLSDYKLTLQSTLSRDLRIIYKAVNDWVAAQQFHLNRSLEVYMQLLEQVSRSWNIESICASLEAWLKEREVRYFFLAMYTEPLDSIPAQSKILVSCVNGQLEKNNDPMAFATRELLPTPLQSLLRSEHLLILPIHSASTQYGYIVFEPRSADHFGNSLSSLGEHIGRSLNLMLMAEREQLSGVNVKTLNQEQSTPTR